jgi:quinol---cytochrome c reductase cytochrome c subunit, bacillus type
MNEEEKQLYLEQYKEKKQNGELFWPHSIAKDAIVSLAVFVVLLCLAVLLGVPNEPPANPSDTSYVPRPEWYFLWAFQLLKYFPGKLEGVAITALGVLIVVGLFGLPFFDRGAKRHPLNRPVATAAMGVIVAGLVFLTIQAVVTTPPQAEAVAVAGDLASRIEAGGKLYGEQCAECHGENGEGAEIKTRPGEFTNPLNSEDFLVPHSSDTIAKLISYGQPDLGMQAFGLPYGGTLTDQEIRTIVDFVESWQAPPEDSQQDLSQIENPSFAKDVKPILDKRCASCHGRRPKGNFSVADYNSVMTSGDNAPVIIAGDAANSTLVKMLNGVETDAGGQMPPSRPLKADQIKLIERWIAQGAQDN